MRWRVIHLMVTLLGPPLLEAARWVGKRLFRDPPPPETSRSRTNTPPPPIDPDPMRLRTRVLLSEQPLEKTETTDGSERRPKEAAPETHQ